MIDCLFLVYLCLFQFPEQWVDYMEIDKSSNEKDLKFNLTLQVLSCGENTLNCFYLEAPFSTIGGKDMSLICDYW